MSCVDYFANCYDLGCKKELVVPGDYRGLILCPRCASGFRMKLKYGFPGEYDEETYDRYIEKYGDSKEFINNILDDLLKEDGIDADDKE